MSDLNMTLTQVLDKIKKFRTLYDRNEMATRDQLINPILRQLGWNPENPEQVQPNVSMEEGVPDYSLFKQGKPIVFVEAKKLSADIEQREIIRQLARYSFGEGTRYGILTNGAMWMLVRSFEEGKTLSERIIWKADLESEPLTAVCRKLTTISEVKIHQIETLVKRVQILDEIWESLLSNPEGIVEGLVPVVESLVNQGYSEHQFDIAEVEDFLWERVNELLSPSEDDPPKTTEITSGHGDIRQIELPGEAFDIRNAYEILINTANWLIKNKHLTANDCPVVIGRGKRYLVNSEPKHRYGDDFRAPKKLFSGLWIETHYSKPASINMARRLLKKFGQSPDILIIE